MTKQVEAIVRGPMPYFGTDGVLYAPGQIVTGVPAEDVSKEPTRSIDVEYEARNGDLRTREAQKANVFAPVNADAATIAGPADTAEVATGQPDRLNVSDFLKGGTEQIVQAITSGSVDDHLDVIDQAEIVRKGPVRRDVANAIAARRAAMTRA